MSESRQTRAFRLPSDSSVSEANASWRVVVVVVFVFVAYTAKGLAAFLVDIYGCAVGECSRIGAVKGPQVHLPHADTQPDSYQGPQKLAALARMQVFTHKVTENPSPVRVKNINSEVTRTAAHRNPRSDNKKRG